MEEITIVKTKDFQQLVDRVDALVAYMHRAVEERDALKKPLMTVKEACEYLGKGATWIDAHKADIGFTKAGGEIRFYRKDVEAYLQEGYFRKGTKQKIR